jgi:hypothetical protein
MKANHKIFVVDDKVAFLSVCRLMSCLGFDSEPDVWEAGETVIMNGHKITAVEYDPNMECQ